MLEVLFVLVGAMVDGLSMTLLHSRDDDRTRPESASCAVVVVMMMMMMMMMMMTMTMMSKSDEKLKCRSCVALMAVMRLEMVLTRNKDVVEEDELGVA